MSRLLALVLLLSACDPAPVGPSTPPAARGAILEGPAGQLLVAFGPPPIDSVPGAIFVAAVAGATLVLARVPDTLRLFPPGDRWALPTEGVRRRRDGSYEPLLGDQFRVRRW